MKFNKTTNKNLNVLTNRIVSKFKLIVLIDHTFGLVVEVTLSLIVPPVPFVTKFVVFYTFKF